MPNASISAVALAAFAALYSPTAAAQAPEAAAQSSEATARPSTPPAADAQVRQLEQRVTDLNREVDELKSVVRDLKDQLTRAGGSPAPSAVPASVAAAPSSYLPQGLTINGMLDGYYEYNFNSPVGRVNTLRAYDVDSNSFNLSQADLLIESAPDIGANKRWGVRLDLQFGQATQATQAIEANEPHPDAYRNILQAYGTYVFPLAEGLTVDFGKFTSSLGMEGSYTKDQINYSRSFWFDYLPYYFMGVRSKLKIDDEFALNFWVVNGANQTEDFNGDKGGLFGFVWTPIPTLSWTVNYYMGSDHPDVYYVEGLPPTQATLPYQSGTYVFPIAGAPSGKRQIATSYLTWQATSKLLLGLEGDYARERLYSDSLPQRAVGGSFYARYRFTPKLALALRGEYFADQAGLFSGATQNLREETLTFDYRLAESFLLRSEFRRDQSDRSYFLRPELDVLKPTQTTLGFGLVWWFGQKTGPW